uniref:Sterile alpha motif domain-containing protein 5 n=1 Tax=Seriola dumerili TaxID=41447 RepID=A0A3B4TYM3_SERDU
MWPNLVLEWLSKLHLAQYVESFIDNGYDDLEVCKQIGEPDLDAIGVRIQYHRHRLITAVQNLKEEDKRKAAGYYFTLEPLDASTLHHTSHSNREDDFRTLRSHPQTTGIHQASCPGNHNLRFTDCNDFVTYPKLKLKVLIRDKLAKDGINLGEAPYTHTVDNFYFLFYNMLILNARSSGTVSWNLIRLLCYVCDEECVKFL